MRRDAWRQVVADVVHRMREHPFTKGLGDEYLGELLACRAAIVTFGPGYRIFREGRPTDYCYLVESGRVALELEVAPGKTRTITTLDGGDVLGWSCLFRPYTASCDAVAVSPVVSIGVAAALLREKVEADQALGFEIMDRFLAVIVSRLQATRLQLLDVYAASF